MDFVAKFDNSVTVRDLTERGLCDCPSRQNNEGIGHLTEAARQRRNFTAS